MLSQNEGYMYCTVLYVHVKNLIVSNRLIREAFSDSNHRSDVIPFIFAHISCSLAGIIHLNYRTLGADQVVCGIMRRTILELGAKG